MKGKDNTESTKARTKDTNVSEAADGKKDGDRETGNSKADGEGNRATNETKLAKLIGEAGDILARKQKDKKRQGSG